MKLSLSIQTPEVEVPLPLALLTGTFEEKCERAAKYGADGVELITTSPSALNPVEIRKCLEVNGLLPAAVSSGGMAYALGLTLSNPDYARAVMAYQQLEALILFAGALGSPTVTIGSFRGRISHNKASQGGLPEVLLRAGDFASKNGVRLALEPLNRYETDFIFNARECLDFLQVLDHPSVGVLLDTFHMNIEESSRTAPLYQCLEAKKLFHFHVADNNRLHPGAGAINFHEILKVLLLHSYTGFISAELLPRPDPDTAGKQTLDYLHDVLETL